MGCFRQPRSSTKNNGLFLPSSFWITAQQPVPADAGKIAEHHQTIAEHVNFCRRIVPPSNGNFRSSQAVTFREEKYFRIESEAFDALLLEDDSRRLPHERLEPALCIGEWQAGGDPHKTVEDHAGKFSQPLLVR